MISTIEPYQNALGIRSFSFPNPSSRPPSEFSLDTSTSVVAAGHKSTGFAAIGSFDGKVRLVSLNSWRIAFTFPLIDPSEMNVGLLQAISTTDQRVYTTVEVPMSDKTAHVQESGGEKTNGASM